MNLSQYNRNGWSDWTDFTCIQLNMMNWYRIIHFRYLLKSIICQVIKYLCQQKWNELSQWTHSKCIHYVTMYVVNDKCFRSLWNTCLWVQWKMNSLWSAWNGFLLIESQWIIRSNWIQLHSIQDIKLNNTNSCLLYSEQVEILIQNANYFW